MQLFQGVEKHLHGLESYYYLLLTDLATPAQLHWL
jgi:hypothetical protein